MHIRRNHAAQVDNEGCSPLLSKHLALFVSQSIFMINFFTQNSCVRRLELRQSHMFSILVYLSVEGTHTKLKSVASHFAFSGRPLIVEALKTTLD